MQFRFFLYSVFKLPNLIHLFIAFFCLLAGTTSHACNRILNADNGQAVLVGRTMDWGEDQRTTLWVYPRGISRDGMVSGKALNWVTKYGSIVAAAYGQMATDGFNEKGLASHVLWLHETNFGKRDEALPGLTVLMWAQFYLDNFATVAEAVRYTSEHRFQIEDINPADDQEGNHFTLHLALEDASGDSAIIEYLDGRPHIYSNGKYKVLTNSPTYDQQLNHLKQYAGFGGTLSLPGTTESPDRFVRGNFYNDHLPKATTLDTAITNLLSVIHNVAEPFGVATPERLDISPTIWTSISDLTHHVYYFNDANRLNFIWAQLDKFNLSTGAHVMKLDLSDQPNLNGDVSLLFQVVDM